MGCIDTLYFMSQFIAGMLKGLAILPQQSPNSYELKLESQASSIPHFQNALPSRPGPTVFERESILKTSRISTSSSTAVLQSARS
jgi:hypothetical protein